MVFVSDIGIDARNLRQRVRPQRCWLMSRSAIAMLSASQGHVEHDLGGGQLALGHLPLELGPREPDPVWLARAPACAAALGLSQLRP